MIQATFTMSGDDFTSDMYVRIKQFIQKGDYEVFIKVTTKETEAEMRQRIEKAMNVSLK
jgi:hypothetical protein